MNIRDRLTRGFLAGLAGGIAMELFSLVSVAVNWVEIAFVDWAGVFIFGRQPVGAVETVIALVGQLFFAGLAGVVFAYLVRATTSNNYLFKGILYSLTVWFGTYALAILFRVPSLVHFGVDTVTSNAVGSVVYGLILALGLKWLDTAVHS